MRSAVSLPLAPTQETETNQQTRNESKPNSSGRPTSTWVVWVIVGAALLTSGGLRFWRDRQFQNLTEKSAVCPFPLSAIPRTLGDWKATQDSDIQLDPEVARVAGSIDHFLRNYTNSRTGETVTVLVLYGLAEDVFAHTPEACFPAAGYAPVTASVDHAFTVKPDGKPGVFRTGIYSKTLAGVTVYREVLSTYRHNDQWITDLAARWKAFRLHPGMFKIQIERLANALGQEHSPSEGLLEELVFQVNHRLDAIQESARYAN